MQLLFYLLIFLAKMIEVTLATVRIVLITKGEKLKGSIIGFFEVIIWIILVSTILTDISSDPYKVIFYSFGFAFGNYVGSIVENKLGYGTVRIESIVKEDDAIQLVEALRNKGFAVTVVHGEGMNLNRKVLIMHLKRKRTNEVIKLIKELQGNVVITITQVKPVYGGYGLFKK